jgi:hypothetical protein
VVLSVAHPSPIEADDVSIVPGSATDNRVLLAAAQDNVDSAAAGPRGRGGVPGITALSSQPHEEIIQAAVANGCDVISASHGRRGLSRLLAGSVTQSAGPLEHSGAGAAARCAAIVLPAGACGFDLHQRDRTPLIRIERAPMYSAVFARGTIMKLSTSRYMARNISGMMTQARRSTALQLERLSHTADDQFADGFNEMIADLEMSFRNEEAAMEALDYPALRSHREQHARALSALHHASRRSKARYRARARSARTAAEVLLLHRSTMDWRWPPTAAGAPAVRRVPGRRPCRAMPRRPHHNRGPARV